MDNTELRSLEAQVYAESYSDGLIDLFVGLAVAWVGIAWLWIDPLAGLAGAFVPLIVLPVGVIRPRIVEPRVGYVSWSLPRRAWERNRLRLLLVFGAGSLAAGIAAFFAVRADADLGSLVAGAPAALLALPALVLGFSSGIRRLLVYGFVLLAGGVVTGLVDGHPGAPLLVGGVVICGVGIALLARFLRTSPVLDA